MASEGSEATHTCIRGGEQRDMNVVANFFGNTTVKEFLKSASIYLSIYERVAQFFDSLQVSK